MGKRLRLWGLGRAPKEGDILLGEFQKNVTIKGYFEFIQF